MAVDVTITPSQTGWVRLDPSACVLKPPTGPTPTDDRECSGRIDLNGDGRAERLVSLYVANRDAVLTVFDGDPSRTSPILEAGGYALLATTERQVHGWPLVATYGDPVSAEERIGVEQAWTGDRYAPDR